MVTPAHLQAPLTDLLTELEAAVRAGNRARATELERAILQRLAAEAADQASPGAPRPRPDGRAGSARGQPWRPEL